MTAHAAGAGRAARWPSGWALALWAWLAVWRAADAVDPASIAPLVGLVADLCAVVGSFALHRAWPAAVVRVGFGLLTAGAGLARGLGALCAAATGRALDSAFVVASGDNPDWFWGARWLLLASLATGPLWASALRRDGRLAAAAACRTVEDVEALAASQRAVAAGAWVLWGVAQVALGLGPGSGAEVRVAAALWR